MIVVEHLTKSYNGVVNAVDDLSFTVEPGQIYGFLGPNGAGKTTTMNIITGYISTTSGTVTVGGHDIFHEPKAAKQLIGYLPEQPPVYLELTPAEYLHVAAGLKKIPKDARSALIERAMETTGVTDVKDRLIRHLSKGYRQRVGLAQAILGDPPIIILDEPTVGLDPRQIIEIRELILRLKENHTVILSSHILQEISAVCDQVMIIARGRLIANDTPDNLITRMNRNDTLDLTVSGSEDAIRALLAPLCPDAAFLFAPGREPETLDVRITALLRDIRPALVSRLASSSLTLYRMERPQTTLEDIYLSLVAEAEAQYFQSLAEDTADEKGVYA